MTDPTPTPEATDRLTTIAQIDGLPGRWEPDNSQWIDIVDETCDGQRDRYLVATWMDAAGHSSQCVRVDLDADGWLALRDACQRQFDQIGGTE